MALNIIVVDDSSVMRSIIVKTLRLSGLPIGEIFEAGNGKEGLGILDRNWVALALVDINMPVMDGVEMIEHIKASPENADLLVIIVSARNVDTKIEMLIQKGAGYIRKPFTPEMLREVVAGLIKETYAEREKDN